MDVLCDEEELIAKHRKERKELQAEIQKLKKSISKGDKKRKKEVTEEIANMEAKLTAQQESELAALTLNSSDKQADTENGAVSTDLTSSNVEAENGNEEVEECNEQVQKKSKAQKRREKKQTKGRERDQRIQEQDVINRQGPRQKEMIAVLTMLKDRGLALHEISADGNCMYNAIAHQLSLRQIEHTCEKLREKTANHMSNHPDDFLPFLTHPDKDAAMTLEEFSVYCKKTANSPVWGGQLELQALSESLDVPIQVLQAGVQPLLIGESKQGPPLTLVYLLHAYRLGEHYNSVRPRNSADDEDNQNEKATEPEETSDLDQ